MNRFTHVFASMLLLLAGGLAARGEDVYVAVTEGERARFTRLGRVAGARELALAEHGRHVVVLSSNGEVWTAGGNDFGQLGREGSGSALGLVEGLGDIRMIAAGAGHSVALDGEGRVWTWGANAQGELGDGTLRGRRRAAVVSGVGRARAVAAGDGYTLVLREDGTVAAFGSNWSSVAPGERDFLLSNPVGVRGLAGIVGIGVDGNVPYAKDEAGVIWTWGGERGSAGAEARAVVDAGAALERLFAVEFIGWEGVWTTGGRTVEASRAGVRMRGRVEQEFAGLVVDVAVGWTVGVIAGESVGGVEGEAEGLVERAIGAGRKGMAAATVGERQGASSRVLSAFLNQSAWVVNGTVCVVGSNDSANLGDGTVIDRWTPVVPPGLGGVSAISAGYRHGLVVKTDGTVATTGDGGNGRLGLGNTNYRATYATIPGLTGVVAVGGGAAHSVALKNDGTVWAWGWNAYGQVGDGDPTVNRVAPSQVTGLSGITQIATGYWHTLALKSDGTVWAWGRNEYGNIGDGSLTNALVPIQVPGLTGVTAIGVGLYHSLAVKSDGTVWAWGYNSHSQLGDGTTTNRTSPVPVAGLTGAIAVAGGQYHSMAIKTDGTVWTWGRNNAGQLGDGTTTSRTAPVRAGTLTGVTAIAAGDIHSLAMGAGGTVYSWGANSEGQLGRGNQTNLSTPTATLACQILPAQGPGITLYNRSLSTAQTHNYVLKANGTAWSWGANQEGQLGDGTVLNRTAPVALPGLSTIVSISAGWSHGLAARSDGAVFGWGLNLDGQIGDGTTTRRLTAVQVTGVNGAVAVAAGKLHSLALKSDGTVWAWGNNTRGQLGDSTTTSKTVPVQVSSLTGVVAIAAGEYHSVALKNDGTVWTWGDNPNGQLGDGTNTRRTIPVQVDWITGVEAIASTANHTLALRSDGTVWGWGSGGNGELGQGSSLGAWNSPVRMEGITNARAIAAGAQHSLVLKSDGTVWATGLNTSGQLGDASVVRRPVPVQVNQLTGVAAIAAGAVHSVALKVDGSLWAWGTNSAGQFGVATPAVSTIPVAGPTGYPLPPKPVSATPANSSAATQTLTFTYFNAGRWDDFGVVNVLINNAIDGRGACYVAVVPSGPAAGAVYLVNDKGESGGPYAGMTLPGTGTVENSQCSVAGAGSSISGSGHTLTLTLAVTFKAAFVGNKVFYVAAQNKAAMSSGWVPLGVTSVPGTVPAGPAVSGMTPGRSFGFGGPYSFTFTSSLGWADVGVANVLLNDAIDGRVGCFIAFVASGPGTGTLYLVNDAGDAGSNLAPLAIPSAGFVENSQCRIDGTGSSSAGSGNTLTLSLAMTYKAPFSGSRIFFAAARSTTANSGWQSIGTLAVP